MKKLIGFGTTFFNAENLEAYFDRGRRERHGMLDA